MQGLVAVEVAKASWRTDTDAVFTLVKTELGVAHAGRTTKKSLCILGCTGILAVTLMFAYQGIIRKLTLWSRSPGMW